MNWKRVLGIPAAAIGALAIRDITQRHHALLRNFPVIGHGRYLLESIGPELRQYITTNNDEERPFSRDQRRWVYASAKGQNNYFGFGTDMDTEFEEGYPILKHRTFSKDAIAIAAQADDDATIPAAKIIGGARGREHAFRPQSVVNISAMSYGSLSSAAIEALNRGAAMTGTMHNTGEGGVSDYHQMGADLIFQIGTGYFGCRDADGNFDLEQLKQVIESTPVKMIEIKLSQGAKPGLGGMLPGSKVSAEIARVRGIHKGEDCASPSRHSTFHDIDSMLDWVEMLAETTGLPVGIKSAIGAIDFWEDLAAAMADGSRGVDFITVDGGEGGTGAAPLVFSDSVALPFRIGFARVYAVFAEAGLTDDIVFIGSGKLGLPDNAAVAFALGCDMINVAREAMMSIGCIQAQRCHTDRCPTGIATQDPWLVHGLDADLKSVRAANYIRTLRRDLLRISEACGVHHPGLLTTNDVEIVLGNRKSQPLDEVYGYDPEWGLPSAADCEQIDKLMIDSVPAGA